MERTKIILTSIILLFFSGVVIYFLYPKIHQLSAINIKVSSEKIESMAEELVTRMNIDVRDKDISITT